MRDARSFVPDTYVRDETNRPEEATLIDDDGGCVYRCVVAPREAVVPSLMLGHQRHMVAPRVRAGGEG